MSWDGDNYFRNIARISKAYRKFCQDAVREYRFTPGEVDVMTFLSNNPGRDTAADICLYKNISKPLVCRSVDALTRRGYLSPVTDQKDRRIIHLHLTPEAADISEHLRQCRTQFLQRLSDGIPIEQILAMEETITHMYGNLLRSQAPPLYPQTTDGNTDRKDGSTYESNKNS